jgi:predicted unusual protein kinase regulating ubiquinone biosynthesis (AarF/ABC1/UbiB family)
MPAVAAPMIAKTNSSLKTGQLARNFAMTSLGVNVGARIALHQMRNVFRSEVNKESANRQFYSRQAQELADQLGKLKGGVMKAGQLLALYGEYFMPAEIVAALSALQDFSEPMAWTDLAPAVARSLGRARMSELEIDESPIGAASLGQVHRVRRKSDGLQLCLKIQYPGLADSIDSDMRTLSRLLMMTRLVPKELDITPMLKEIQEMLHQEVDYRRELHFTQEYATRLSQDRRFVVPQVMPEYSGHHVLTMTFEPGVGVHDPVVSALSQERRNRLSATFIDLILTELFEWRMVQTDPNFGNYFFRLNPDGNDVIVLIDFGATRLFTSSFIKGYRELISGALMRDLARIVLGAVDLDILKQEFPNSVKEGFARMCEAIVEPFEEPGSLGVSKTLWNAAGEYRWGESDLPERAAHAMALSMLTAHFRLPPRDLVFLHRRLTGLFIMLRTLRAEVNGRPRLKSALKL